MPSVIHEILVELFRSRPELAPQLVEEALHVELPDWTEVTVQSADFGDLQPTEYRADLVLVLGRPKPVFGFAVEVQLSVDRKKPRTWLHYANTLAMRHGCPTAVLVVTPDEAVARWADREWDLGPGLRYRPLVLRNTDVPAIRDPMQAAARPELAVLSAVAHGHGDVEQATEIALMAAHAVAALDGRNLDLYIDFIRASLGQAARLAFEANMSVMDMKGYVPLSDWGKEHFYKGMAEGKAKSVIQVLEARGIDLSPEDRERILRCVDNDELDRWVRLAVTVPVPAALWATPTS